jgi:hypothetical protein
MGPRAALLHSEQYSNEMKGNEMPVQSRSLAGLGVALLFCATFAGCQKAKPVTTAADIALAQADAQKELEQAHVEARKDVKNAVKLAGGDSKEVALARVTGSFDIAMANADGAHKVAIEQCLTEPAAAQQPCKDRADADYQSASANAKAARLAQLQKTS